VFRPDDDRKLANRISTRSTNKQGTTGPLRQLLIHRLRPAYKAIWRVGLKDRIHLAPTKGHIYCEPCNQWFPANSGTDEFTCPVCDRMYVQELTIYTCFDDPEETDDTD